MSFMSDIGWPVIVNIISAALLALLGYGLKVVPKLTKSIAKTITSSEESEEVQIAGVSEVVNHLIQYLSKGGHSFDWLREKPVFEKYTNEQFENIISSNSKYFKKVNIIRRDDTGNRVVPGRPGIKLSPEAIKKINEDEIKIVEDSSDGK